MNEIEDLKFELAKSLVLNFFYSHYYIIFENSDDVAEFLSFINSYDKRYSEEFTKKQQIKSVMWKYANSLHKHQLEWQNDYDWFKKYGAEPLEYEKIKPYISEYQKMIEKIKL